MELFWDAYHEMILLFSGVIVLVLVTYMIIKHGHNKKTRGIINEIISHENKIKAQPADTLADKTSWELTKRKPPSRRETTPRHDGVDSADEELLKETHDRHETTKDSEEHRVIEERNLSDKHGSKNKETDDAPDDADDKHDKELGKYHVLYRKENKKWYVKREGSDKVLRVLPTQKEAVAWATIKAIHQDTALIIHKRNGQIRKHQKI